MDKLTKWMEKHFIPIAAKIGNEKHLIALRDAFIGTMPAVMAGSLATMINALIRDLPTQFFPNYDGTTIPVIKEIISVNGFMWNGSLAIVGLVFAFSWGYNLAKMYKVDALAGGIVALAASFMGLAMNYKGNLAVSLPGKAVKAINEAGVAAANGFTATGKGIDITAGGWVELGNLSANFYFTAIITGFVALWIFAKLIHMNIVIKMPDSVPPAVSKAFVAIIPSVVALYALAIFYYVFSLLVPDQSFLVFIQKIIAEPLLGASQGYWSVLLITFLVQLLWFFGIHGTNVMAPILESVFTVAQLANMGFYKAGGMAEVVDKGYMWVRGSFDIYAWFGGAGGTVMMILALVIFSKRQDYKTIGKLSLAPGIFNINEPVMFGLPVVLNPIMVIPFVFGPLVSVSIGYFATAAHLVNPVSQQVVWVTPPLINAFLATNGDWRAVVWSAICMLVTFLIYVPFVLAANRMANKSVDIEDVN
ncbi:PTS sugar transporter subunit IIC [Lactobacillus sp. YT155]|uniref:PTS sugar transporter subunit IIC n=1 Tax=Lactobacillus sp. YT155 TaxID=3060955 RepID=UPI00265D9C3E|nr:PTS sugar transporter subunit IIC [Lactobacillus sp. YT155]MDO1604743.1 PTS sugar transporter subunit IIC [Lactobacillus sp. YT155]